MRVIAGTARGVKLATLDGGEITRPTLDRVKEGVFSALNFLLPGASVLELFAGSGQLGIEALSRGASTCVFIDNSAEAQRIILENVKAAALQKQARVASTDAVSYVANCREKFDIILLDPPFHHGTVAQLLPQLAAITAPRGVVMAETELAAQLPEQAGCLTLAKTYKYGTVRVWRYVNNEEE